MQKPNFDIQYVDDPAITISIGQSIGACTAFFMNGVFMQYYKKGDATSKHCYLFLTKEDVLEHAFNKKTGYGATSKLVWKNSYNTDLQRVEDFYNNLGRKAEMLEIKNGCTK